MASKATRDGPQSLSGSGLLSNQEILDASKGHAGHGPDVEHSSRVTKKLAGVRHSVSGISGFCNVTKPRSTPRSSMAGGPQGLTKSTDQLHGLNLHSTAPSKAPTSSRGGNATSNSKGPASQAKENAPLATGLVTSRAGTTWTPSKIPRLATPRTSTQSAFGRTISGASASAYAASNRSMSPTSSIGSVASKRHLDAPMPSSTPPRPAAKTPPSLAAAAAAAASLVAAKSAAAKATAAGPADASVGRPDQQHKRLAEIEQDKHQLEAINLKLEKENADLAIELKRANAAREQAETAAKAAVVTADQRLQELLNQVTDAKHSSDAASTTSELIKRALSQHMAGSAGLYAELEQEKAAVEQLEHVRENQEALIQSLELQAQRLGDELETEREMSRKLATQVQEAKQASYSSELRTLQFEVTYLQDCEGKLKWQLEQRERELQVSKDRQHALQEDYNKLKLEGFRLNQKLSEESASESALLKHEEQLKHNLKQKLKEQQQLMDIIRRLNEDKEQFEDKLQQQAAAAQAVQKQLDGTISALDKLRAEHNQLTTGLEAQLAAKGCELQAEQQVAQQLQQQVTEAASAKEQADGFSNELLRNLERLTQELAGTRVEKQQLDAALQDTQASLAAAQEELELHKAELVAAQLDAADGVRQVSELEQKLASAEESATALKEELTTKAKESPEVQALHTKAAAFVQQLANLQKELQQVTEQHNKLAEEKAGLQAEKVTWQERLESSAGDIDQFQKQLTKKVQCLDALQAELNTAVQGQDAAELKAVELSSQLQLAKQQLSLISSKNGELQILAAELAAVASAKAALEAKLAPKEKQLADAKDRIAALAEQLAKLNSQHAELRREMERMHYEAHAQIKAKQEKTIAVAGELQVAKEESSRLQQQLSAICKHLETASAQVSQHVGTIAHLESTKKQLQEQVKDFKKQHSTKEAECQQLLERMADKQQLLAAAEDAKHHYAEQLAAAKRTHSDIQQELAVTAASLQALQHEHDILLQQQGSTSASAASMHCTLQDTLQQLAKLKVQAQCSQEEAIVLRHELAGQSTALRQLQEQHRVATNELKALQVQHSKLHAEKKALKVSEVDQAAIFGQLAGEVQQLRQQLDGARQDSLQRQLAANESARQAAASDARSRAVEAQLAGTQVQRHEMQGTIKQQQAAAHAAHAQHGSAVVQFKQQLQQAKGALNAQEAAERHAADFCEQLGRANSLLASQEQLQHDYNRQAGVLAELERHKSELLGQLPGLQAQLAEANVAAQACSTAGPDESTYPAGGSWHRRSKAQGAKGAGSAASPSKVEQATARRLRHRQLDAQEQKRNMQRNLLKQALMWSGSAGAAIAAVVMAAVHGRGR